MSAAAISDPTFAYRRDARKLRGQLARRPVELYRSLRQLSDRHDEIRASQPDLSEPDLSAPDSSPLPPSSQFAFEVREFLRDEQLTFSTRQQLLRTAQLRGIARFEANLIIAAVQHRMPGRVAILQPRPRPISKIMLIAAVLLSQLAIGTALWALLGQ